MLAAVVVAVSALRHDPLATVMRPPYYYVPTLTLSAPLTKVPSPLVSYLTTVAADLALLPELYASKLLELTALTLVVQMVVNLCVSTQLPNAHENLCGKALPVDPMALPMARPPTLAPGPVAHPTLLQAKELGAPCASPMPMLRATVLIAVLPAFRPQGSVAQSVGIPRFLLALPG